MSTAQANSRKANASVDKVNQRAAVERTMRQAGGRGLADYELHELLPSIRCYRSRRLELVRAGVIFASGATVTSRGGLPCTIWVHRKFAAARVIDDAEAAALSLLDQDDERRARLRIARQLAVNVLVASEYEVAALREVIRYASYWRMHLNRNTLPVLYPEARAWGWSAAIRKRILVRT